MFRGAVRTAPDTPASGYTRGYFDSVTKRWRSRASDGSIAVYPHIIRNHSAAGVSGVWNADTYLGGSSITVPIAGDFTVDMVYRCRFDVEKTAAGVAQFTITVRMGTAGTTADTSIMTFAFTAGSAAADKGIIEVEIGFKTVGSGSSAVLVGTAKLDHALAATGLTTGGTGGTEIIKTTSAGFNSTTPTVIGLSVNGGAAFSGSNLLVRAELAKVA